jgi:hypothetical protein
MLYTNFRSMFNVLENNKLYFSRVRTQWMSTEIKYNGQFLGQNLKQNIIKVV